jgi:hypothetical protein
MDGRHQGHVVVLDILGSVVDVPLGEVHTRPDFEYLTLRPVCEGCGWHTERLDTLGTHPLVLAVDGSVDAAASLAGPRREWELHAGEPVRRALALLRSLPLDQRIAGLREAELALKAETEKTVVDARTAGWSWERIGPAFNIARQNAIKRWKRLDPRADTQKTDTTGAAVPGSKPSGS